MGKANQKCVRCGQWSNRGHSCPPPTIIPPPTPALPRTVDPLPSPAAVPSVPPPAVGDIYETYQRLTGRTPGREQRKASPPPKKRKTAARADEYRTAPPTQTCRTCFMTLPNTGICDNCSEA